MTTVEIDPNTQVRYNDPQLGGKPLTIPDWATKIVEDIKVDIKFDPPLSLSAAQKLRLELIWMDRRCRNPCNWTRWTYFAHNGYGYNEGDQIYRSKGRLTYPVQSLTETRRKLKLRYPR